MQVFEFVYVADVTFVPEQAYLIPLFPSVVIPQVLTGVFCVNDTLAASQVVVPVNASTWIYCPVIAAFEQ